MGPKSPTFRLLEDTHRVDSKFFELKMLQKPERQKKFLATFKSDPDKSTLSANISLNDKNIHKK